MQDLIVATILYAIELIKKKPSTRELSIVITKLQEALLWYREATQGERE